MSVDMGDRAFDSVRLSTRSDVPVRVPARRHSIKSNFTPQQSESEGERLMKDAAGKRLAFQGCNIFKLCSNDKREEDREVSISLYVDAAHHFLNCGQWERAGECYESVARLQETAGGGGGGSEMEAAANYAHAALCYKQHQVAQQKEGKTAKGRSNNTINEAMERVRLPSIEEEGEKLQTVDCSLSRLAHMQMEYRNYQRAKMNFDTLAEQLLSKEETEEEAEEFLFKAAMCDLADRQDSPYSATQTYLDMVERRPHLENTENFEFWIALQKALATRKRNDFLRALKFRVRRKLWVRKIMSAMANSLGFYEIRNIINDVIRRESVSSFKDGSLYTMYS